MAVQILPGQGRASMLGESMGTGLGKGLQTLMQHKLDAMLQQKQSTKTSKGLEALGIPEKEASQISQLPDAMQSLVLKNYLSGAESSGLGQALSGLGGDTQGQAPQEVAQPPQEVAQPGREVQKPSSFQEILKNPRLKPEHRLRIEQMAQQERLAEKKLTASEKKDLALEQREVDKETLPYYKEVMKANKDSKENRRRLGRMEELVRKGKLDSPIASSLLDTTSKGIFGFGINLDSLRSPDSQEFKKLSTEFLKNAKSIFGNRITNSELEIFMSMIPTLTQSDQGKLRVVNNMKAYAEAEDFTKNAMDRIIEQNNGRRPRNLELLVEKSVAPELDRLAETFKKGYNIQADLAEDRSSFVGKAQKWLGDMPFNI